MATPTDQEQLVLELVNRARLDPLGEAERYGIELNEGLTAGTISATVKAPLAMNGYLIDAARAHSTWMLDTDTFSHTGVSGSTPWDRMAAAGYSFTGSWAYGENISWSGSTGSVDLTEVIYTHHQGLFLSPGHRVNILGESFVEFGAGQEAGVFAYNGTNYNASMLTEAFARTGTTYHMLTGVIFNDGDGDDFYSVGEGLGSVTVSTNSGSTSTSSTGGYSINAVSSTVSVTFSGGVLSTSVSATLATGSGNTKLDLMDRTILRSSASITLGTGATGLILLGDAATGTGNSLDNTLEGNRYANTLNGEAGNDTLSGGAGDDMLSGGSGTNVLIGGDGDDTAVYTGTRSAYTITSTASGYSVISASSSDTLTEIEYLQFSDQTVDLSNLSTNTAPILAVPTPPTYTDTAADDTFTTATGSLSGSDQDGDTLTYGLLGGTFGGSFISTGGYTGVGTSGGSIYVLTGSYGTLSVYSTGTWNYTPDDAAIEALKTTASDTFTVTVSDGQATASQPFTVLLYGADDPTVFSGVTTGSVTEDGTLTASGVLTASDRDTGDAVITAQTNAAGTYGAFSITTNGQWTYTLDNTAGNVQALNSGQTATETLTVTTAGGAAQTVTISINGADEAGPTLTSLSPADNATGVAVGSNLVLTFSDAVQAGTGNIVIYTSAGIPARTIAVTDSSQVSISGNTVTINPASDLSAGSSYYVAIASGVFTDLTGHAFTGISGSTAYNFSTASTDNDDYADTVSDTTAPMGSITVGGSVAGNIETAYDHDLFQIAVVAGTTYTIEVRGADSNSGTLSDPYLQLLDSSGTLITYDDDGGTGRDSLLTGSPSGSGLIYIDVAHYSTGTGTYLLRVTSDAIVPPVFSEYFYLLNNTDVAAAVDAGVYATGWAHYVRCGWLEGRSASEPANYGDFSETFYLLDNPDVAAAVRAGYLSSGWAHYDAYGRAEGRSYAEPEGYASYSEEFYLLNNPDVAAAVRSGQLGSGWAHYTLYGQAEGRSCAEPDEYGDFSEGYYLLNNPDVARAVAAGFLSSGWTHYDAYGRAEGRSYAEPDGYEDYSELYYLTNNIDVAAAVRAGVFMTGWEHYSLCGQAEGRSCSGQVLVGETTEGADVYLGDDGTLSFASGDTTYAILDQDETQQTSFHFTAFGSFDSGLDVSVIVTGHTDNSADIELLGTGTAALLAATGY